MTPYSTSHWEIPTGPIASSLIMYGLFRLAMLNGISALTFKQVILLSSICRDREHTKKQWTWTVVIKSSHFTMLKMYTVNTWKWWAWFGPSWFRSLFSCIKAECNFFTTQLCGMSLLVKHVQDLWQKNKVICLAKHQDQSLVSIVVYFRLFETKFFQNSRRIHIFDSLLWLTWDSWLRYLCLKREISCLLKRWKWSSRKLTDMVS